MNNMNTFENLEVTFKNEEAQKMDSQTSRVFKTNSGVEFHYTLHTLPTLKLARIGTFHELVFNKALNLPQSFLDQATAWSYALRDACSDIRNNKITGFVAIRMKHDSDLMSIAMQQSFIPTVDDTGVEMVIRYFPAAVDQKSRCHFVSSSSKEVTERVCHEFGTVQLRNSEGCKMQLANHGLTKVNPGLKVLAQRYAEMPLYKINVEVTADSDHAPATFSPYVSFAEMLMFLTPHDFETRLVGIVTHNRFEGVACLRAGFFPLASEVEDEGIYIRYF